MPRLENWSIISNGSPYQAPELFKRSLHGNIYEDNRFKDGSPVDTSTICELDLKNNTAKTRNTTYILGKVSDEYLKWLESNNMKLEQFI